MLIIVRHGRTEANARGLLLGSRLDPGLDDLGRRQAEALASALPEVERVVSSPLLRTRETADAFGLPVEIDDRWAEVDYGHLDGTALRDVPPEMWARWQSDVSFAPPGGESLEALGRRVRSAVAGLIDDASTRNVVVVTHVSPVKAALAWALGVGDEVAWRAFVAPASITRVALRGGTPSLHAFNVVGHLDGLSPPSG